MKRPTEKQLQITKQGNQLTLVDFRNTFVQGWPSYTIKPIDGQWHHVRASRYPLYDQDIQKHLNGKIALGTYGKWYPIHGLVDFDNQSLSAVDKIREVFGMNEANSMLCTSESQDSYHLLFRPTYNSKPPTLNLLTDVMQPFVREHGLEAYPSAKQACRLPFSKIQQVLEPGLEFVDQWQQKLYWFDKLDEYELSQVPFHQQPLALELPHDSRANLPSYARGRELFEHGLQAPHTRHESQFYVLYYLWRRNVSLDTAIAETYKWIKKKHNGFSQDIVNLRRVKSEIRRQACRIYAEYAYPDEAHNTYYGWVAKEDIPDILHYTDASLPRARFLFHLVKYFYPRRVRPRVTVHRDLLVSWSGTRTYQKRVDELGQLGIAKRSGIYIVGQKSKDMILSWNYRHPENAILVDERAPDTLEDTLRASYQPEELRALLKQAGMDKGNSSKYLKQIFAPRREILNPPQVWAA
jgi:hypothetical protein